MLTTKNYRLSLESDYDFKAWRWYDSEGQQVIAAILNHRRKGPASKLGWVFRIVGQHGKPIINIAWRSDSRDWSRTFRAKRLGLFGSPFEVSRSCNGPGMSR